MGCFCDCRDACWTCSQSHHAVMHDLIPIFPCDNAEENGDSFSSCGEVGMPVIREDRQNQITP